jgi:hypothetical protein
MQYNVLKIIRKLYPGRSRFRLQVQKALFPADFDVFQGKVDGLSVYLNKIHITKYRTYNAISEPAYKCRNRGCVKSAFGLGFLYFETWQV